MLENAVDGLTELRNIKTTAAQLHVTTGTIISYDGYVSLPYSAAQSYDTHFLLELIPKDKNEQYINMKQFQKKTMKNMITVFIQI